MCNVRSILHFYHPCRIITINREQCVYKSNPCHRFYAPPLSEQVLHHGVSPSVRMLRLQQEGKRGVYVLISPPVPRTHKRIIAQSYPLSSARSDPLHRHTHHLLNEQYILPRPIRPFLPPPTSRCLLLPPWESLIFNLNVRHHIQVRGKGFEFLSVIGIRGGEPYLLKRVKDIEFGQIDCCVTVHLCAVLHDNKVEPSASTLCGPS